MSNAGETMDRRTTASFDDATLLAYVEQTLTRQEEADFEAAAASEPDLLASLRQLRADREVLRAMPEPQAPATLAADVLAQIERSLLLETDLVAPSISLRRYRAPHWQRYAAAAGFVLLLTGGGFWLLNSLRFDSRDEHFAPETIAGGPAAPEDQPVVPRLSPQTPGDSPEPAPSDALAGGAELPAAAEGEARPGAFEALVDAMTERDESLAAASIESDWPADLDLSITLTSADPASACEALTRRLHAVGADLIVNASINSGGPLPGRGRSLPGLADVGRNPDGLMPREQAPTIVLTPPTAVPDERVPLEDQSRYVSRGFQFTLLGTPSDILAVLREVSADRSMRLSWSGSGAPRMLVDLTAPNLPRSTRWDRVMLWWVEPATRFDEARLAAARAFTEPVVRLPVRLVSSERR